VNNCSSVAGIELVIIAGGSEHLRSAGFDGQDSGLRGWLAARLEAVPFQNWATWSSFCNIKPRRISSFFGG
jgi:hypothetical protein